MVHVNRFTADRALAYAVLTFVGILFIIPLLWMIFAAFDPNATLSLQWPKHLSISNFSSILTQSANQQAFLNGLILSLGQSIVVVIVAGLAAYPLSRYQLKYKRPFMYVILFSTSLPITAVMVPVYELFVFLHMQDSIFWTMMFLSASGLPYAIWIMKNFMDSVPIELEEAAWTDGASAWTSLRRVVAPLMVPGIFTVGIFTFAGSWGNFFVPFILIQSPSKLPASVSIYQFFGQYGMVEYGKLAAFSMLYTIPAVVLYIIGQRYMSAGFSFGGATKG
ncbi:carbohydrate ABC transporter permease [Alicyclobacillus fastidiosus]|uniref:Carbohydrate ABC transporter permease n=1 Tax=Alicyclobacillus fastidiosus TaxID=392011 RepID=A0ABV5ABI9_9BACL|nr:carbohydrate ABC transporter permease [Alicyclobacillus fastidiosus]WEH10482.1 carbohydrate ABC transporter permease [Alicyclobacillus fastidiosus]